MACVEGPLLAALETLPPFGGGGGACGVGIKRKASPSRDDTAKVALRRLRYYQDCACRAAAAQAQAAAQQWQATALAQALAPPPLPMPPVLAAASWMASLPVGMPPSAPAADHEVVTGMAVMLENMASLASGLVDFSSFHAGWRPQIRIGDYVAWLRKSLGCSVECFVLGMIYIDRTVRRSPSCGVTALSCHRLLACSMTLAAKFQDDAFYKNAHYATVSGLGLQDLNQLQRSMLKLLDYKLFVEPQEFERYRDWLAEAARWASW